jgi:hypothetical protein
VATSPVVLATGEAEAGELLQLMNFRPAWTASETLSQKINKRQVWQCTCVFPAPGRLRQED